MKHLNLFHAKICIWYVLIIIMTALFLRLFNDVSSIQCIVVSKRGRYVWLGKDTVVIYFRTL
jgi:hypothetical protein